MLTLKKADIKFRNELLDFRQETLTINKRIPGGAALESADDIEKWLNGDYIPHYGKVNEVVYLAFDESDRMIGIGDIRLETNEFILNYGGQIGYTVRPSERGKGYASEILKKLISEAYALGMDNILVTCNEDNIASARVIEKAGGTFESIIPHEGFPNVKRYRFKSELNCKTD